jgi:hypothetical protein
LLLPLLHSASEGIRGRNEGVGSDVGEDPEDPASWETDLDFDEEDDDPHSTMKPSKNSRPTSGTLSFESLAIWSSRRLFSKTSWI